MLQKSDPKGAEAALNRVFRVEPDYRPDTSNYPPSFQKWVDKVRKAAKKKSTARLEVSTSPRASRSTSVAASWESVR